MKDIVIEILHEAYSKLQEIVELLNQKKGSTTETGFRMNKFDSAKRYKANLMISIDDLFDLFNHYEFFVEMEEMDFIKEKCAKEISKVIITVPISYNNKNWSDIHFEAYKQFRTVQQECKSFLLKSLQREKHIKYKGKKFIWQGSQRQLIELFDTLINKDWIHKEEISEELMCLPIIEMFDIIKNEKVTSINSDSFNKEWKPKTIGNNSSRLPAKYESQFEDIPINQRTSKK